MFTQLLSRSRMLAFAALAALVFSGLACKPASKLSTNVPVNLPTQTNSLGMKLVGIPAGEFLMGSATYQKGRNGDENQHTVKITRTFYMQTTPVTQAQWKAVMGDAPSRFEGDDRPVEKVSWNDAVEFCRRLSEKESRHYRLPTEAEWEYACRAGSTTAFNGSGQLQDMAWYDKNSKGHTHAVGGKKPNAWGLYDMHGNVWQWCSDYYMAYAAGESSDPTGSPAGDIFSSHVLRGGAWDAEWPECRSASRSGGAPGIRFSNNGLRVCLDN